MNLEAATNEVLEGSKAMVGAAAAIRRLRAENDRMRVALEKIAKLDLPYRDTANRARHLAREALDA